jgi:hypothetical protein
MVAARPTVRTERPRRLARNDFMKLKLYSHEGMNKKTPAQLVCWGFLFTEY